MTLLQIHRPTFALLLLLCFSSSCSGKKIMAAAEEIHPLFTIVPDSLREYVKKIIATPAPRCFEDTASLNSAADYIKGKFEASGYTATEQLFTVNGKTYKNIIAIAGPKQTKRIVIGAHYDVCGRQPGADDNASGVAGLLECAKIAKENECHLTKQIEFVAYSLEEPPNYAACTMGSYLHAKSLYDNKIDVECMIALEMIGYFSDEPKSQRYPLGIMKLFYPTTGNFITVASTSGSGGFIRTIKKIFNQRTAIRCCSVVAPRWLAGVDFSDHRNYLGFHFKALMITDTAFYRNPGYHTSSDMIETLDFVRMAEVVKGVAFFMFN
jgi:Zn-dependent M28 family amino/carboxypeptidase